MYMMGKKWAEFRKWAGVQCDFVEPKSRSHKKGRSERSGRRGQETRRRPTK